MVQVVELFCVCYNLLFSRKLNKSFLLYLSLQ